jgi:hypothetical protein
MFCSGGTTSPLKCDIITNIKTFVNCALGMNFLFIFISCVTIELLSLLNQLGMYDFVSLVF